MPSISIHTFNPSTPGGSVRLLIPGVIEEVRDAVLRRYESFPTGEEPGRDKDRSDGREVSAVEDAMPG